MTTGLSSRPHAKVKPHTKPGQSTDPTTAMDSSNPDPLLDESTSPSSRPDPNLTETVTKGRTNLWESLARRTSGETGQAPEADGDNSENEPDTKNEAVATTPETTAELRANPGRQSIAEIADNLWGRFWVATFRRLGAHRHHDTSALSPSGGRDILVVAGRPGDEIVGCAGTLLAHTRSRDRVTVLQISDGSNRPAFGLSPTRSVELYRNEAREAGQVLGFDQIWTGLSEFEPSLEISSGRIGELLDQLRPAVIYTPSRIETDSAAAHAARALALALSRTHAWPEQPAIRVYGIGVPLTPALANLITLVAKPELAHLAFTTYLSRRGELDRHLRRRQLAAGLWQVPQPAEELWQLTAPAFHHLHQQNPSRPPESVFCAIGHAWSDPLTFLRGRRERLRLARQALLGPLLHQP